MSDELSDIQKLIRLKRYEKPPEGYFDDFLLEFQRRQRAEVIRRPMWQLAWERANLWMESFRVPAIAYASILVAAIGVTGLLMNGGQGGAPATGGVAATVVPAAMPTTNAVPVSTNPHSSSYILEKRPVSYDAPFSF